MQWKGPFEVIERVGVTDYRVQLESGTKVFHINMLEQYFSSDGDSADNSQSRSKSEADEVENVAVTILEEDIDDSLEVHLPSSAETHRETVYDVHICPDLTDQQKDELCELLNEFSDIFTDLPGKTHVAEHRIQLTDSNPVSCKRIQYRIPCVML